MARFSSSGAGLTLLGLGLVELALSRSDRSVVDTVGRVVVDTTPLPIVEGTIRVVGTTDKPVVRGAVVSTVAAAGGVVSALGGGGPRRGGHRVGALAAVGGLAAYTAARRGLTALRTAQDDGRRDVTAADPLPARTDGAEGWSRAEPLFTPVEDFYATDVNLRPPLPDPTTWELELAAPDGRGAVGLDRLRALDLRERDALLVCVHNRLGWDRLGHQRWTGVPVAEVFAAAGVALPADAHRHELVMEAVDGYRQVMPLHEALERDAWVVLGMGGRELPTAHGWPARVMIPGVVGQYNGVKWLSRLEVAPRGSTAATWVARGWPRATVEPPPMARIDHPGRVRMPPRLPDRPVEVPSRASFVGTAWAPGNGGVDAVEVRVDGGAWRPAELAEDLGPFSWRRWRSELELSPGRHDVAVRCVAADGTVQLGTPSPPFPDGTSGHHTVRVTVPPDTA